MRFSRSALLISTLLATVSAVTAAPSVSQLTELFLPSEYFNPALSPKQDFAAFIVRRGDAYGVGSYALEAGKLEMLPTGGSVPLRLWWKTADQLLVQTANRDETSIGYTLLSADGHKSEDLERLADSWGDIVDPLPDEPRKVLMYRGKELGKADIKTGHFDTIDSIGFGALGWFDEQRRFRAAFERGSGESSTFRWYDLATRDWKIRRFSSGEGEYSPLGFDTDPRYLWVLDSTRGDEAAVGRFDTTTGECVSVARRPGLDPTHIMTAGPMQHPIAAVYVQGAKAVLAPLDEAYRRGIELLQQKYGDLFPEIVDATRATRPWLVFLHNSRIPGAYALFDSSNGTLRPIARTHGQALSETRLAPAELFSYVRRNGERLTARLWRPAGAAQPPLIVLTPGQMPGPPVMDTYDATTQAFVECGYAVIRVNTRGTWGFGKTVRQLDEAAVAQAMTEDLEDAVAALTNKKVVDGTRVALVGDDMAGVLAMQAAKTSTRFAAMVVSNAPAKVTQYDLLSLGDSRSINQLSNRLGGWFKSIAIADQMSPVVVAPQIRIPALYLFNEESIKGRMIEAGRDVRAAATKANAPVEFELAYSYSKKPKLPTAMATESAQIVLKAVTFLDKVMPSAKDR